MKKKMKKTWYAVLLAVMMAFVLSGCGASSKYSNSAASDEAAPGAMEDVEYEVSEDAAADEPAMDYDVKEDAVDDAADSSDGGMTDAASGAVEGEPVQPNEKIIYTYNYSVETKTFDTFMDALQKRINEYGGYLESSETNGNPDMNIRRYANMVIRIPENKMHSFLNMVEENSNVTYSSQSSENVTLNYVDMQSHIKALKTEQETLMGILERAKKLEDIITIQTQLTQVRYELESYESQLRVYDNRINYSTLYLDINEVERETSVATELSYGEEISRGLSDTFYGIGQGLRGFSIWFIVNLPILLIWAVIIVLIILIARKTYKTYVKRERRRREARLEAKNKSGQTAQGGLWTSQDNGADDKNAPAEEPGEK